MSRSRISVVALLSALSLATLGGCSSGPQSTPTTPASTSDDRVQAAVADLARRHNTTPDAIEVVSQEQVTWPDGSLGCPKPGKHYTEALVPGDRLVLRTGGRQYAYHASRGNAYFYCEAPSHHRPVDKSDR